MNYLIDPQGQWWRWPSPVLAEKLGYADPDFDLGGYATRNLGYTSLLIEDYATVLQFRAGMVSRQALDTLKPYLAKAVAKKPVVLVFFASGWTEELYVEAEALLARMEQLGPLREPRQRDQFICHPHQPRDWLYNAHHNLSALFELWRFVDGVYTDAAARYLSRSGLIARTVTIDGNTDSLRIAQCGEGFSVYDSFTFHGNLGKSIADQPDAAYGNWVAQAYRRCRDSGEPQIDDIDAIIEEPGHDPRRRRYQRLILRWRRPGGDLVLTGSSMLNQNISIPLDAATTQAMPGLSVAPPPAQPQV